MCCVDDDVVVWIPGLLDLVRERAAEIAQGGILGAVNDRSDVIRGEGLWTASMLQYPLLYCLPSFTNSPVTCHLSHITS